MSSQFMRNPRPRSLLATIQAAEAGFTGLAQVVKDQPVEASETSFAGPGHRITAEITPEQAIFGPLPGDSLQVQGDTPWPPDKRSQLGEARFPPDTLRQEPYWGYARAGQPQPVLVLLADAPAVYPLSGPDDELPETVALIHRWTQLDAGQRAATVLADLKEAGRSPIAYVAGFELLMATTEKLPGLAETFLNMAGLPGAAAQGILDQLYLKASSLSPEEIRALAEKLLAAMSQASEPAALLGYLTWFDAHRRAWRDDPAMKAAVVAQAERAEAMTFSGPYGTAWEKRVRQQAAFVCKDKDTGS